MRQDRWTTVCAAALAFAVGHVSASWTAPTPSKAPAVAGWSETTDKQAPTIQVATATAPMSLPEQPVTLAPHSDPGAEASPADSGAAQPHGDACTANDLKAVAKRTGQLAKMAEITKLAGLGGASANVDSKLTIFAPTDAAFEALPEAFRTAILKPENKAHLVDLLLHHVVIGRYTTRRLLRANATHYGVEAVDGTEIEFTTRRGLDVHGAKVLSSDLEASNGILHVIDKVLVPAKVLAAIEAQGVQTTAEASTTAAPAGE